MHREEIKWIHKNAKTNKAEKEEKKQSTNVMNRNSFKHDKY